MNGHSALVPMPLAGTINTKYSPARPSTLIQCLGSPDLENLTTECEKAFASKRVKELLVTEDVGPFKITGIRPFVALCRRVFAKLKAEGQDLYDALVTAGCFCARLVRGSATQPSTHTWGCAIDLGVGTIDRRGDGKVQRGLLVLYRLFKEEGCFWGAGFRIEDAMHFEASDQLIRKWKRAGVI